MQVRSYQDEAWRSVFEYFQVKGGNPLVAMPTGTGKSVVIALLLRQIYNHYPQQRVMMLTHVKELIAQNFAKLMDVWPAAPAGVYSAGLGRRDVGRKITFAGIGSVAKKPEEFGHIDLIFVDEAHTLSPKQESMYQAFLGALKSRNPFLKVVGFTATPYRLGHGKLHEDHPIFTDVCFDITGLHQFNRLLAEGYLCPLVPKRTEAQLDVDGVHMRGGEYIASELQAAVDKQPITYAALKEAVQLAGNRWSWLLFCAGVEHSLHVAEMLTNLGIPCKSVHSDLPTEERDATIRDWKAGRLRAVANNNVLTTGVDHPALDCIVMLRPTASTVLWVQMLGRGTRPFYADGFDLNTIEGRLDAIAASHKQNCLVLDFARNTAKLGPINDPLMPRKKGEKLGEAPVKLCPACATYVHASLRHCPFCGTEFPVHGPRVTQSASTEELIKETELPITEVLKVDHLTYAYHMKAGKPPSMRVTYFCGQSKFSDYVLFEHDGFGANKARRWWRERIPGPMQDAPTPENTLQALELAQHLKAPTHLRVWTNKKPYPQIMAYCFDGTAFGAQEADIEVPSASVENMGALWEKTRARPAIPPKPGEDWDDDIPF